MSIPKLTMLDDDTFANLVLKCGKHISRITYKKRDEDLHPLVLYKLSYYISRYCFNITNLDLSAIIIYPKEIKILAENCKNIEMLVFKLHMKYNYEKSLTMLFKENKNLEDITLYNMQYIYRSLMKLPVHKIKAITLNCNFDVKNILYRVSIIQFFFILFS